MQTFTKRGLLLATNTMVTNYDCAEGCYVRKKTQRMELDEYTILFSLCRQGPLVSCQSALINTKIVMQCPLYGTTPCVVHTMADYTLWLVSNIYFKQQTINAVKHLSCPLTSHMENHPYSQPVAGHGPFIPLDGLFHSSAILFSGSKHEKPRFKITIQNST